MTVFVLLNLCCFLALLLLLLLLLSLLSLILSMMFTVTLLALSLFIFLGSISARFALLPLRLQFLLGLSVFGKGFDGKHAQISVKLLDRIVEDGLHFITRPEVLPGPFGGSLLGRWVEDTGEPFLDGNEFLVTIADRPRRGATQLSGHSR